MLDIKQYVHVLKSYLAHPDKYAHLKQIGLFQDFNVFEMNLLNNCLHKRSYKAGELLYDKDYPLEMIFLILQGRVEVEASYNPGTKRILSCNEFLGLIDMFYESVRSSSARAITPVQALAVSKSDLEDLIRQNPKLGVKFLMNACKFFSEYIMDMGKPKEINASEDAVPCEETGR